MDKEQINELKPGDEVLIRGRFVKIKENGDFRVDYLLTTVHDKLYMYRASVHPSAVIIKSPPKHDPCRLFKKGDRVRIVECKGRRTGYDKRIYKVCEDEEESGRYIKLSLDGFIGHFTVDAAYIELVIPVEEIEQYNVVDAHTHWDVADKDMKTVAIYSKSHHPNAKAAAEAERDRLNAKSRKERNNE